MPSSLQLALLFAVPDKIQFNVKVGLRVTIVNCAAALP